MNLDVKNLDIKQTAQGITFPVKVVPGSSRTKVAGLLGNALKVNIAAPPEKGKANKELIQLLAKWLDLPKNHISVVAGHQNPHKELMITGVSVQDLIFRLENHIL